MFQASKGKDKYFKKQLFCKASVHGCIWGCSSAFCKQVCIQWKPIHIQPCRGILYKTIKNF